MVRDEVFRDRNELPQMSTYGNANIPPLCLDCDGALTTFEHRTETGEFGQIMVDGQHQYYILLRSSRKLP